MTPPTTAREYPNVKARLRLSRRGPALPARESDMEIWLKGPRFRVRDRSGRDVGAILGDITHKRGLGAPPASMEEIMDIRSRSLRTDDSGETELYGDLATGEGWVRRLGQPAWPIPVEELVPAAEQILAGELHPKLEVVRQVTRLGRPATEYHGFLGGDDPGASHSTEVTRIVSGPYLLLNSVRDVQNPDHYYTRDVVSLEEGGVTDSDLELP